MLLRVRVRPGASEDGEALLRQSGGIFLAIRNVFWYYRHRATRSLFLCPAEAGAVSHDANDKGGHHVDRKSAARGNRGTFTTTTTNTTTPTAPARRKAAAAGLALDERARLVSRRDATDYNSDQSAPRLRTRWPAAGAATASRAARPRGAGHGTPRRARNATEGTERRGGHGTPRRARNATEGTEHDGGHGTPRRAFPTASRQRAHHDPPKSSENRPKAAKTAKTGQNRPCVNWPNRPDPAKSGKNRQKPAKSGQNRPKAATPKHRNYTSFTLALAAGAVERASREGRGGGHGRYSSRVEMRRSIATRSVCEAAIYGPRLHFGLRHFRPRKV